MPANAASEREALLAALRRYAPLDAREERMRAQLEAFVAREPGCFERTTLEGHVTGSAWVVDRNLTHVVLLHHRKLDRWLQPGGHADGDGDVARVAQREAREESGLLELESASGDIYDLDVHEIPARGTEPEHLHFDVRYAFFGNAAEVPQVSDESHAVRWIALDALAAYSVDESVARLARKTPSLRSAATESRSGRIP